MLQLAIGIGLLIVLFASGKAAVLAVLRADLRYAQCLRVTLAADVLSLGLGLGLILVSPLHDLGLAFSRWLCRIVISGSELLAPLLLFGVVNLSVTGSLLSLAQHKHILRSWFAAALAVGGSTALLAVTVVVLFAPPPFLVAWTAPGALAARTSVCSPAAPTQADISVTPQRPGELTPVIQRGVQFLVTQYNPDLGLLQESPNIGQANYYLTNDNALAAYTLATLGVEPALAAALRASLPRYGYADNGFVETVWGEPITWPPYHHADILVLQIGDDRILQETHAGPGYFYDWSAFANLAFMAVLNEHNLGYAESARRLYEIAMRKFDGLGWRDLAYDRRDGAYETLGAAYALLAAARINAPLDERVLHAVLLQQDPRSGGFHTHYRDGQPRLADPNVETTCITLLALHAWSQR